MSTSNYEQATLSLSDKRDRREKMAKRVRETGDVRAVAEEFEVSDQTVYRACREFGVENHIQHRQAKESTLKIVAALCRAKKGDTIPIVAHRVGCTRQRVAAVLKEAIHLKLTKEIPLLKTWQ